MRALTRFILILGLFFGGPAARSSGAELESFQTANKSYERGAYKEAIEGYKTLIRSNFISAPIYFNLANSLYKSGQIGEAIFFYRLASRLAPRDPDIRGNLRFIRDSLGADQGSAFENVITGYLNLDQLSLLGAIFFWIWLLLLAARQWKPSWVWPLRLPTLLAAFLFACFALWTFAAWNLSKPHRVAIVKTTEAVARFGPLEESQTAFTARDGSELQALSEKGDWTQVRDGRNRLGWIHKKQILLFP